MMSSMAGYVLGVVVGGQLAQAFGWRTAFLVVGLPGLALAVITQLVLDEPRRRPQLAVKAAQLEPLVASVRALVAKPAFVNIAIAMVLYFLIAYGAYVFIVSLMIRLHGVTVGTASAVFGTLSTVSAIIGSLLGGALADRLAKRDLAWVARLPGWGLIIALPIYEIALLAPTLPLDGCHSHGRRRVSHRRDPADVRRASPRLRQPPAGDVGGGDLLFREFWSAPDLDRSSPAA